MKFIQALLTKMNLSVERTQPRGFVRFAKEYFKGQEVTGVEIGVYKGENAQQLLKHLKFKKLFLVDSYEGYADYTTEDLRKCYNEAQERLKPYKDYEFIIKKSEDFFRVKREYDFIYLDGAHDYENVRKDMENAYPLIKKGGVLAGHDINQEEVFKAVSELSFVAGRKVHLGKRNDWWVVI